MVKNFSSHSVLRILPRNCILQIRKSQFQDGCQRTIAQLTRIPQSCSRMPMWTSIALIIFWPLHQPTIRSLIFCGSKILPQRKFSATLQAEKFAAASRETKRQTLNGGLTTEEKFQRWVELESSKTFILTRNVIFNLFCQTSIEVPLSFVVSNCRLLLTSLCAHQHTKPLSFPETSAHPSLSQRLAGVLSFSRWPVRSSAPRRALHVPESFPARHRRVETKSRDGRWGILSHDQGCDICIFFVRMRWFLLTSDTIFFYT